MDRTELEKEISETDVLDADSSRIAALLRAMPRVEAPGNFEFGVKAKIAAAGRRSGWNLFPFLKVAAPLSLVLLVVASVMFYGSLPTEGDSPTVADTVRIDRPVQRPAEPPVQEKPEDPAPRQVDQGGHVQRVSAATNRTAPVRKTTRVQSYAPRKEGSVDLAVEAANVILPPGFESNLGRNPNANAGGVNDGAGIPIAEILQTLGLKAKFVSGGWIVQSITQNSVGDRSGVKVNDVIEALGDQVLGAGTTLKGGFGGKAVRIRRDGKQITIVVNN